MRVVLAQLNPLVGDLIGNGERIKATCIRARAQDTHLVLTPELSLWGYPPRDLLLSKALLQKQKQVLDELVEFLCQEAPSLRILVGIAEPIKDIRVPQLFNSIALVQSTGWEIVARKQLLPTYDVFDEKRYFRPAETPAVLNLKLQNKNWKIGITICEDLWVDQELQGQRITGPDPIAKLLPKKIDLLINLSASPFSHSKEVLREQLAIKAVQKLRCPMIYLNQTGGNDELVFDGASFVLNSEAKLSLKLPNCEEAIAIWDTTVSNNQSSPKYTSPQEQLFRALVLGVHDYASKCGFDSALIGLSGGIDSALVAIIASAALGSEKVTGVLMPSPWSSSGSIKDAQGLAERLHINTHIMPIESLMKSFNSALLKPLGKSPDGITAENLQSRIRGTLLMALANQNGHLLLSTGNKSELAVGYCTLYGDMNGGLSVIGDLYKTCVFKLCEWIDSETSKECLNTMGLSTRNDLVGSAILKKPPSAELRPGQLDSDSLPDYALLDPILKALIEDKANSEELINSGHDPKLISQVQMLLKKGEFKRRQAPPLLKVTHQAFGSGWRVPIAAT